jgi:hypothetical protein
MMPQEWPIAADAGDGKGPARTAGRRRLSTVRLDFFLDPAERLTEQERALMTAMLQALVGDIAGEIRGELPAGWTAANDDDAPIVEAITRAGLVDDPELMALLLRRADEERIGTATRARSGRREARVIQGLVSNEDGAVSAAAMALILARGRRRDRFGQSLIAFDDLPRASAERLVFSVAAALRGDLASTHGETAADAQLGRAAAASAEKHAEGRSIEALTNALIVLLDNVGGLSDELLLACAQEGEIAFLGQVLARRARIPAAVSMDELLSGSARRLMTLMRVAGSSRDLCAGLLASIGDLLGLDDLGAAIDFFDRMTADEVHAAETWLSAPRAYRAAVQVLGSQNG